MFPLLFAFYVQGVLKFKCQNSGAKRLTILFLLHPSSMYNRGTWSRQRTDSNTGLSDRMLPESGAQTSREQTAYDYTDVHRHHQKG
jgi:hypothetical protein